jgi:hypothetical protein
LSQRHPARHLFNPPVTVQQVEDQPFVFLRHVGVLNLLDPAHLNLHRRQNPVPRG